MNMNSHIVPIKVYTNVILALLGLTVLTVASAQVDFGWFNVLIAMGIATVKAALVLLYFMHLKYDDRLYLVIFLTGVFFLIVILFFCEFDLITRIPEKSVL